MKWWETLWKQDVNKDVWKDPDPDDLTVDNAYKTRWILSSCLQDTECICINKGLEKVLHAR